MFKMLFHWRQHKVYQHSSHFRRCYPLCPNCRLLGLYKSWCLQYHPNVLIYIFWHVFSNLVLSSSIKGIINHLFAKTKYLPTHYLWVSFLLVEFITWKSQDYRLPGGIPKTWHHSLPVFLRTLFFGHFGCFLSQPYCDMVIHLSPGLA